MGAQRRVYSLRVDAAITSAWTQTWRRRAATGGRRGRCGWPRRVESPRPLASASSARPMPPVRIIAQVAFLGWAFRVRGRAAGCSPRSRAGRRRGSGTLAGSGSYPGSRSPPRSVPTRRQPWDRGARVRVRAVPEQAGVAQCVELRRNVAEDGERNGKERARPFAEENVPDPEHGLESHAHTHTHTHTKSIGSG